MRLFHFCDAICARVRILRPKTIGFRVRPQSTHKLNLGPIGPTMRPESCANQSVDGPTDRQTDWSERHSLTSVGLFVFAIIATFSFLRRELCSHAIIATFRFCDAICARTRSLQLFSFCDAICARTRSLLLFHFCDAICARTRSLRLCPGKVMCLGKLI